MATTKSDKKAAAPWSGLLPYSDHQQRSCLLVARAGGLCKYIPMAIEGFDVLEMPEKEFDDWYKPMVDYPADRAAQLYLSYMRTTGASKEALDALGTTITVSKEDYTMATTKKAANAATAATKTAAPKAARKSHQEEAAATPAKAGRRATDPIVAPKAGKTTAKPAKAAATNGKTAGGIGAFCKELIIKGKSNEEVLAAVHKQFPGAGTTPASVSSYRSRLKSDGLLK